MVDSNQSHLDKFDKNYIMLQVSAKKNEVGYNGWSEATASASKAICTLHQVTDFAKKMELDQIDRARLLPIAEI